MKNRLYLVPVVVALMVFTGWTTHAQLQKTTSASQAWEYAELKLDARFEATTPKLNKFGQEGWELVTVVSACTSGQLPTCTHWAYMKRPK